MNVPRKLDTKQVEDNEKYHVHLDGYDDKYDVHLDGYDGIYVPGSRAPSPPHPPRGGVQQLGPHGGGLGASWAKVGHHEGERGASWANLAMGKEVRAKLGRVGDKLGQVGTKLASSWAN